MLLAIGTLQMQRPEMIMAIVMPTGKGICRCPCGGRGYTPADEFIVGKTGSFDRGSFTAGRFY